MVSMQSTQSLFANRLLAIASRSVVVDGQLRLVCLASGCGNEIRNSETCSRTRIRIFKLQLVVDVIVWCAIELGLVFAKWQLRLRHRINGRIRVEQRMHCHYVVGR